MENTFWRHNAKRLEISGACRPSRKSAKIPVLKPVRPDRAAVPQTPAGPESGETGSITLELVSPSHADAQRLIRELDSEIAALYPDSAINGINSIEFDRNGRYFVLALQAGEAVGCGGFRRVDDCCAEIKRMFVRASARRHGIARQILRHLEAEIGRQGFSTIVLETGCDNAAALALYQAEGYFPIPAFLGYVGIPISRCFAKWA